MEILFFKSSFGVWIWPELELFVLALEPSSLVSYIMYSWGRPNDICLVIVVPLDNCEIVRYIGSGFAAIAMPATSLLFFFRLKAVYRHSRIIITIFGIFWLAIAGLCVFPTLSITIREWIIFLCCYIWMTVNSQITYRTHDTVPKGKRAHISGFQYLSPLWMILSSSLLFPIAWFLSR